MNLRPRRVEEPDVNLTPLIDVVFLLLIFFMVSTTFRKEVDLKIELPTASEASEAQDRRLEIAIDSLGRMYVNDQPIADDQPEALKMAIVDAVGDERDLPFVIRADGRTPHQAVVKAMDIAGLLGFRQIAIATVSGNTNNGSATER